MPEDSKNCMLTVRHYLLLLCSLPDGSRSEGIIDLKLLCASLNNKQLRQVTDGSLTVNGVSTPSNAVPVQAGKKFVY